MWRLVSVLALLACIGCTPKSDRQTVSTEFGGVTYSKSAPKTVEKAEEGRR